MAETTLTLQIVRQDWPSPAHASMKIAPFTVAIPSDPDLSKEAEGIKAAAANLHVDSRLYSAPGLVEVANQLGVAFVDPLHEGVTTATFEKFCAACAEHPNSLVGDALVTAVAGRIFLDHGRSPVYIRSAAEAPGASYLSSLQFLNDFLERPAGSPPAGYDAKVWNYFYGRFSADFRAAIAEVLKLQAEAEAVVVPGSNPATLLGPKTPNSFLAYDRDGRFIASFPFFAGKEVPFVQAADVMTRPCPTASKYRSERRGVTVLPRTTVADFFSAEEYPRRSVVEAGTVTELVGFAPMIPNYGALLFRLDLQMSHGTRRLADIIMGAKCVTDFVGYRFDGTGSFGRDNLEVFAIPSGANSGKEEYFSVGGLDTLGVGRIEEIGVVGSEASQTLLIVLRPSIHRDLAAFYREVIAFKGGTLDSQRFWSMTGVKDYLQYRDELPKLVARGILSNTDVADLYAGKALHDEARRRDEEARARAREFFLGANSRDIFMMGDPGLAVRQMHFSGSGLATGYNIRHSGFPDAVDPFTPPQIFKIRVFPVSRGMGPTVLDQMKGDASLN